MKDITKQYESDLIPNFIDISLAEAKGLSINGQLTDDYFQLQSIYYHLLELYIGSKLDIKDLENNLIKEKIQPVEDSEKDIYQYMSDNQYFYIRNTLYVEKLSKETIAYLISIVPTNLTEELSNLIETTFKDVITSNDFNNDSFAISYGPLSSSYFAGNSDLVMGFRIAEEDDSLYENEDVWFDDYTRRRQIISKMLQELPKIFSERLNVNCKIIEYFEESVKKKSDNISKKY